MTIYDGQHIFFVDDEPKICKAANKTLEKLCTKVSCFTCAFDCLEQLRSQRCDLLITDVKMPGMDGIELLAEAKRITPWLPVMVITGFGDIPMAVRAMKAGASNFIEKPLDRESFLAAVESMLMRNNPSVSFLGESLTKAERKVLHLVLDGKSNKEIAHTLCRSKRTVEVHRSSIMFKLGVDNLVDLVKRANLMELI